MIGADITGVDWICGVPDGAVPLAAILSSMTKIPLLFVRKERKEHGTKKLIEGDYKKGDKVVVVEDVVNTGGSLNRYCAMLSDAGLDVVRKQCIVSRGNVKDIEQVVPFAELVNPSNILLPHLKKNIIWAADVGTMVQLFKQLDVYGPKIKVLKLHIDTFRDFSHANLVKLIAYKNKYQLIIWEDRKFADIGFVMMKQIQNSAYSYSTWVDIFSIHGITGSESLDAVMSFNEKFRWILIGQLSSVGNLIDAAYTEACKTIYHANDNIVGIVTQEYLGPEFINIVPGISKHSGTDSKGQSYKTQADKSFADFYVIGRSIDKFI